MAQNRAAWTNHQWKIWEEITWIIHRMMKSENDKVVFDLYCEADNLYSKFFIYDSTNEGDDWYGCRMFRIREQELEDLKKKQDTTVTYNLYGCNVTINN